MCRDSSVAGDDEVTIDWLDIIPASPRYDDDASAPSPSAPQRRTRKSKTARMRTATRVCSARIGRQLRLKSRRARTTAAQRTF